MLALEYSREQWKSCPCETLRWWDSDHHMGKRKCHNCKYSKGRNIVSAGQILFNNFRWSVRLHLHRGVCSPVQQLVGSYVARGRRACSGETCLTNVCEPSVLHCAKDLPNSRSLWHLGSSGICVVDMPLVVEHPSWIPPSMSLLYLFDLFVHVE